MADDEFKDVGRLFGEGEYVTLPGNDLGDDLTIEGWFIWMSGDGPLYATLDGETAIGYDRDGFLGYRVGGIERETTVTVESLREHWRYVVLAKSGQDVILRIDNEIADHWTSAPTVTGVSEAVVMKNAVGFAAEVAYYPRRLPDDRIDAHWNAGKHRV